MKPSIVWTSRSARKGGKRYLVAVRILVSLVAMGLMVVASDHHCQIKFTRGIYYLFPLISRFVFIYGFEMMHRALRLGKWRHVGREGGRHRTGEKQA